MDGPIPVPPPVRLRRALVADLFCGAGGSSTGAARALRRMGIEMTLTCVNHWPVAIDTHRRNHPEARHHVQDVSTAKPRELVPEGRLDLLMASPTCTHHSRARGGRPTSDQQRMDPWAVVHWLTEIRVKRLIVENVPEFVEWGPVNAVTGKAVKSRRGEYFRAWWAALEACGGRGEWRILNAADHGDATTRHRFFAMLRFDGVRVRWPAATHAPADRAAMLGLKPWRAARAVIDWSLPGRSIFDRPRPLAPATLRRIEAGLKRFGGAAAEPFLVVLRRHMAGRSLDVPLPTITAQSGHLALVQPYVLSQASGGAPRGVADPLPTILTGGAHALVEPLLSSYYGASTEARPVSEPVPTVTTKDRFALVEPFLVPQFGERDGQAPRTHAVEAPLPAVTSHGAGALVAPFLLPQHSDRGGAPRVHPTDQPVPTVTTVSRIGVVEPTVMHITHGRDVGRTRPVDEPLPTVTCANRGELALIEPRLDAAHGRTVLVDGEPHTLDILFRMLQPHELAGAMGFDADELPYEFSGTKTDVIRQIGNAVPVNTATALVAAIMED